MHIEIPVMSNIGVKYDEGELPISPKELLEMDWNLYEEVGLWEDEIDYDHKLGVPNCICSEFQAHYDTTETRLFWVAQWRDGLKKNMEKNRVERLTKYYFYILVSIDSDESLYDWFAKICKEGREIEIFPSTKGYRIEFPDGKEQLELMNLAIQDNNYGFEVYYEI